jgi:hypothetical protein
VCYLFGFEVGVPLFGVLYALTSTRRIFPKLQQRLLFSVVYVVVMGAATYLLIHALHLSDTPPVSF